MADHVAGMASTSKSQGITHRKICVPMHTEIIELEQKYLEVFCIAHAARSKKTCSEATSTKQRLPLLFQKMLTSTHVLFISSDA